MARSNTDDFDGYRKWLGVSNPKRIPTHYELLAISLDEDDPDVIQAAAEQRRHFVESKRGEGHDDLVTEILYRIDEAESTLLNTALRRDYDRKLDLFEKRQKSRQYDPNAPRSRVKSRPGKTVGEDGGIVKPFVAIMAVVCIGFGGMAWFSFGLPWSKPVKHVDIAEAQPPQPVVVQPPRQPVAQPPVAPPIVPAVAPVAPPQQSKSDEDARWKFWDVFRSGAKLDNAIIVSRDGVLVSSGQTKGVCLASLQDFSECNLKLEFQFPSNEVQGNPYVGVASSLPNPDATDWTKQIPRGIEVKLNPNTLGQLVLPTEDFKVELKGDEARDAKDKRKINAVRKADLTFGDWNSLEINSDKDRNVAVTINGTAVNRLGAAQSISGHVIIWTANSEMRVRNVVVGAGGAETKMSFDRIQ